MAWWCSPPSSANSTPVLHWDFSPPTLDGVLVRLSLNFPWHGVGTRCRQGPDSWTKGCEAGSLRGGALSLP